jgi:hypothetical protein
MSVTERYRTLPGTVPNERYPLPPLRGNGNGYGSGTGTEREALPDVVATVKGPATKAELKRRVAVAVAGYFADAPTRARRNRWRGQR